MLDNEKDKKNITQIIVVGVICIFLFIGACFGLAYLYRNYSVWSSGMAGKAQLMEAEWNRQIAVKEAEAKKEAAISLAQAEIERAKGVAEANKIIGNSLKDNEQYLRYLWIENLNNSTNKVIYIPTEANLPILEAARLQTN